MTDILYVWKDGASSVGLSGEVQLPQFSVLGHRQRSTVVALSTGEPPPDPLPTPIVLPESSRREFTARSRPPLPPMPRRVC